MEETRISFEEYGMNMALEASKRSEDPYRKVGAVAFDHENRIVATAYNGTKSGFVTPDGFWDDRDLRQKYMLHAEANLCSHFKRGDVKTTFVTTLPCTSCIQTLVAHGVEEIFYKEDYPKSESKEVAKTYGISLKKL